MKKLENILAENMRRFNTKNLTEQAAAATSIVNIIKDLDPELPALLDTIDKQRLGATGTIVKTTKNSIVQFTQSDRNDPTYTLDIYKIYDKLPIPVPYGIGTFTKRTDSWRKGTGNDVIIVRNNANQTYSDAGKTATERLNIPERLNSIWNTMSWATIESPELLTAATNYVITNAERFKPAFHQFTRSTAGIKQYWNDNPRSYTQSQYYIAVDQKVTDNAKKILKAIQDTELLTAIQYKVKNYNGTGKYPSLKIPSAIS
jgi:hypothetical protein